MQTNNILITYACIVVYVACLVEKAKSQAGEQNLWVVKSLNEKKERLLLWTDLLDLLGGSYSGHGKRTLRRAEGMYDRQTMCLNDMAGVTRTWHGG